MKKPFIPFLIMGISLLFSSSAVSGQDQFQDTLHSSNASKNAVLVYKDVFKDDLNLFNGVEYQFYDRAIQGNAYFPSHQWYTSTLNYDGNYYENIPLLYDIVKDVVIVKYAKSALPIRLITNKLAYFTLDEHKFVYITADQSENMLTSGLYDELIDGQISLLVKRKKTITSKYNLNEFTLSNYYYLKKDNKYYAVDTKKSVYKILGKNNTKEIQLHLKKEGVNFNKHKEWAISLMVAYYDLNIK